ERTRVLVDPYGAFQTVFPALSASRSVGEPSGSTLSAAPTLQLSL
ncbi:unnamed protein product, partial [marine sediment metagenome]